MSRAGFGPVAVMVAGMTLVSCARNDAPGGPAGTTAPATTAAAATTTGDIALVEERVLLGRTVPGGYVTGTLRIRAGARGAVLTQVEPTCGCTESTSPMPVTLGPGEVFEAPVALDLTRVSRLGAGPDGGPNTVERDVIVASRGGTRLVARVAADVTDSLLLEPAQLRLGSVPPGATSRGSVTIRAPAGSPAPAPLRVESSDPSLAATLSANPDGTHALSVAWTPAAVGRLDGRLTLEFGSGREPSAAVRVLGEARSPVMLDPERIENLAASPQQPLVVLFTLRRLDESPLQILEASCTSHRVRLTVRPGTGSLRQVEAVIPVLPLPQEVLGTVTFRTDAPGAEVLTAPIRVRRAT